MVDFLDTGDGMNYYAVIVAKRGSQFNVFQLQDKRACFPGNSMPLLSVRNITVLKVNFHHILCYENNRYKFCSELLILL